MSFLDFNSFKKSINRPESSQRFSILQGLKIPVFVGVLVEGVKVVTAPKRNREAYHNHIIS